MNTKLGFLLLLIVTISMAGNAYAHTSEILGDYKLEIGWKNEPPIAGIENAIELVVTQATEFEKEKAESHEHDESIEHEGMTHEEHEEEMKEEEHDESIEHEGMTHEEHEEEMKEEEEHVESGEVVSGLSDILHLEITLDKKITTLELVESEFEGVYHGKYTPSSAGQPVVHILGDIAETEIDIDMHPEKVEELSILPPLKQTQHGIYPADVQCKEGLELFKRTHNESAICVSPQSGQKLFELGAVDYF